MQPFDFSTFRRNKATDLSAPSPRSAPSSFKASTRKLFRHITKLVKKNRTHQNVDLDPPLSHSGSMSPSTESHAISRPHSPLICPATRQRANLIPQAVGTHVFINISFSIPTYLTGAAHVIDNGNLHLSANSSQDPGTKSITQNYTWPQVVSHSRATAKEQLSVPQSPVVMMAMVAPIRVPQVILPGLPTTNFAGHVDTDNEETDEETDDEGSGPMLAPPTVPVHLANSGEETDSDESDSDESSCEDDDDDISTPAAVIAKPAANNATAFATLTASTARVSPHRPALDSAATITPSPAALYLHSKLTSRTAPLTRSAGSMNTRPPHTEGYRSQRMDADDGVDANIESGSNSLGFPLAPTYQARPPPQEIHVSSFQPTSQAFGYPPRESLGAHEDNDMGMSEVVNRVPVAPCNRGFYESAPQTWTHNLPEIIPQSWNNKFHIDPVVQLSKNNYPNQLIPQLINNNFPTGQGQPSDCNYPTESLAQPWDNNLPAGLVPQPLNYNTFAQLSTQSSWNNNLAEPIAQPLPPTHHDNAHQPAAQSLSRCFSDPAALLRANDLLAPAIQACNNGLSEFNYYQAQHHDDYNRATSLVSFDPHHSQQPQRFVPSTIQPANAMDHDSEMNSDVSLESQATNAPVNFFNNPCFVVPGPKSTRLATTAAFASLGNNFFRPELVGNASPIIPILPGLSNPPSPGELRRLVERRALQASFVDQADEFLNQMEDYIAATVRPSSSLFIPSAPAEPLPALEGILSGFNLNDALGHTQKASDPQDCDWTPAAPRLCYATLPSTKLPECPPLSNAVVNSATSELTELGPLTPCTPISEVQPSQAYLEPPSTTLVSGSYATRVGGTGLAHWNPTGNSLSDAFHSSLGSHNDTSDTRTPPLIRSGAFDSFRPCAIQSPEDNISTIQAPPSVTPLSDAFRPSLQFRNDGAYDMQAPPSVRSGAFDSFRSGANQAHNNDASVTQASPHTGSPPLSDFHSSLDHCRNHSAFGMQASPSTGNAFFDSFQSGSMRPHSNNVSSMGAPTSAGTSLAEAFRAPFYQSRNDVAQAPPPNCSGASDAFSSCSDQPHNDSAASLQAPPSLLSVFLPDLAPIAPLQVLPMPPSAPLLPISVYFHAPPVPDAKEFVLEATPVQGIWWDMVMTQAAVEIPIKKASKIPSSPASADYGRNCAAPNNVPGNRLHKLRKKDRAVRLPVGSEADLRERLIIECHAEAIQAERDKRGGKRASKRRSREIFEASHSSMPASSRPVKHRRLSVDHGTPITVALPPTRPAESRSRPTPPPKFGPSRYPAFDFVRSISRLWR